MKWKTRTLCLLFLFFMYLIVITHNPSSIAAVNDFTAPYYSGDCPTINGNIAASEWINASKRTIIFQSNYTGDPLVEVELYLLHNGSALFIGIKATTADNNSDNLDAFIIYFDEEHNEQLAGNTTHPKEEGLKLTRNGTFTDLSFNGANWINDESVGILTRGPNYGETNGVGEWEFVIISSYDPENRIATDSSDFDVNLPSNVLESTVEIGFNIEYYDADIDQYDSFIGTFNGTLDIVPTEWGNLIFGKVPPSPPNILVIWAYIIIAMIVPLGVILFVLIWLKRKKIQ